MPSESEYKLVDSARKALDTLTEKYRRREGKSPSLVEILRQYPELPSDDNQLMSLIEQDLNLRLELELPISAADYDSLLQSWPHLQSCVHDLVASRKSTQVPTATVTWSPQSPPPPIDARHDDTRDFRPDTATPASPGSHLIPSDVELGNRYRIRRCVAMGAFGAVYQAYDKELLRDVAIKVPRHHIQPERSVEELRTEAQKLAALSHPNLVAVYDFGIHDSTQPYLVTEYLQGYTLRQRLDSRSINSREATLAIQQVCEALHHAHRRGLIHRDIKPDNIIFDAQGRPRLADFGLALLEDEQSVRRGEVAGTPSYMSPEQVCGKSHHLDGRADIWAIGVMLYEIWAGQAPFRAAKVHDLFEQIRERPAKPLSMACDAPAELCGIVTKCLQKAPDNRFQSAQEVADALANWLHIEPRATAASPSSTSERPSALVTKIAVTALLAVAMVGVSAFCVSRFWPAAASPYPLAAGQPFNDQWQSNSPTSPAANASTESRPLAGAPAGSNSTLGELNGDVSIVLWNNEILARRGIPLQDAFPLQSGDVIRLDVQLDEPAYVYLFWVSADGVSPLYPWRPGEWDSMPTQQAPTRAISLPEQQDEGWPLELSDGLEAVVMLARRTPLVQHDLPDLLGRFPIPRRAPPYRVIRLDEKPGEQLRGLGTETKKLIDEVQTARQYLATHLRSQADLVRAVGFLNPSERSVDPRQSGGRSKP